MPQPGEPNYDKLFYVRKFLEDLKTNFRLNYDPHRQRAIDEAMIKYKGKTSLKQYMPMKPIKTGIKMWCRADSTNGYLCEFDIHTGKSPQGVQHGLGYSVVTQRILVPFKDQKSADVRWLDSLKIKNFLHILILCFKTSLAIVLS